MYYYTLGSTTRVTITSSRISDISSEADTFLNIVLSNGTVFSYSMIHCGSLLSGMITIPNASFEFQLEGFDIEANKFMTNVNVMGVSRMGKIEKHLL